MGGDWRNAEKLLEAVESMHFARTDMLDGQLMKAYAKSELEPDDKHSKVRVALSRMLAERRMPSQVTLSSLDGILGNGVVARICNEFKIPHARKLRSGLEMDRNKRLSRNREFNYKSRHPE